MSNRELVFFDADGTAFEPKLNFNGKALGSTYHTHVNGSAKSTREATPTSTIEDFAKSVIVDGLWGRVGTSEPGSIRYLRFDGDPLVRYQLDATIAHRLGIPAEGRTGRIFDLKALSSLQQRFLAAYPDFLGAGAFAAATGTYQDSYRQRVDVLLAAVRQHPENGWAVLQDVLTASQSGRGALPPFFDGDVNWRTPRARDVEAVAFDAALDALVRGGAAPATAIVEFNKLFWPALGAIGQTAAYRDTRVVPSTVLAAVAPDQAISVRYQLYSNAARMLTGRTLFANKPLGADEYRAVLHMASELRAAFDEWGWHPRDLWDVHGFILATCADRDLDQLAPEAAPAPSKDLPMPTNLILYGPPGTGKTYTTAERAVALCGEEIAGLNRAAVMERYRALEAQQRIRFVTFHQSYAYEDFVEGLRPTTGSEGEEASGGFRLEPRPGVFREIAALAEQASKAAQAGGAPFDIRDRQVFKMSLGRAGAEDHIFDAAIEGDYVVLGWGGEIDWTPYDSYEAVHARWNEDHPGTSGNDSNITQVYRFRCSMQVGDLVVISYGNTRFRAIGEIVGDYEYAPTEIRDYAHRRRVRWLYQPDEPMPVSFYAKPFTMRSCYMLREEHLNREALALLLPGSGGAPATPKQFVLICDEINRGNISKVFGELITLLEPDKRLGAANEIKVRLPYSGDTFGVPANLHIIGTMNTADRSIALIDKALRRRFSFTEMMPLPDLPELAAAGAAAGVDLPAFLRALNDGIEYLLDREHQIGHAWLLGCTSRDSLDAAMRERIIPLIAEYFFEDWGKVAAVLGGEEDNPFLQRIRLQAPAGYRDEEPRYRWRVREGFAEDAYARVIGA